MAPVANENAKLHFEGTVLGEVEEVDAEAVWGVGDGQSSQWKKAKSGDYILFYPGDYTFTQAAKITGKKKSRELGKQLWNEYAGDTGRRSGGKLGPWQHILFLEQPFEVKISSVKVQNFADYSRDYPQNFQAINEKGHAEIRHEYGSVENFIKDISV
jgi:hypothetical protein